MIINKSGVTIRLSVDGIRVVGRATQGVKLIDLRDDLIASVAKVDKGETPEDETTELSGDENGNEIDTENFENEENTDNLE
jgi:DNA gyrase subunit A